MDSLEAIEQLKDLIIDRKSFDDEIFRRDEKALEIAIEALEKQIPKRFCYNKPTQVKALDSENGTVCAFTCKPCPTCGKWIVDNVSHKYCEYCGQALEWGEDDGT